MKKSLSEMKTYGKLELRNCDCMDLMKEYPDKHFDLAIVDPPYGIGNFIPQHGKQKGNNFKAVTWNDHAPTKDYFLEVEKVSKNQIIWGANYYNCFTELGGAIVWDKNQFNPKLSRCELASHSFYKKVDYVNITCNGIHGDDGVRVHPCQKPVALYRWLLQNYAKEGDKILDTHLGSGSIAIACYYMGFDLTGSELDEDYYKAMIERIDKETAQQELF